MTVSPSARATRAHLLTDRWPVVVIRLEDGVGLEDIEPIFERYDREVYARREPFISVTDLRRMSTVPDASFRKRVAEWSHAGDEVMSEFSQGNVSIFDSKLIRGAVTAVFWIYKPPVPQGVAGTWEEAIAWCDDRLKVNGIEIPPASAFALRADPFAGGVDQASSA